MRVLVLNVGSSSIKGSVVDSPSLAALARAEVSLGADATKRGNLRRTVENLIRKLGGAAEVEAVGHRVVHGGTRFRSAVRIDARVLKGIEELAVFAPLHNRLAAQGIRAAGVDRPWHPSLYGAHPAHGVAGARGGSRSPVGSGGCLRSGGGHARDRESRWSGKRARPARHRYVRR